MWILYILSYFYNRLRGMGSHKAYLNNIFEREAYDNEHDITYLIKRKPYSWTKYLFK